MALRGTARHFNESGQCGHQKLVWCASPDRLLAHYKELFPGAAKPVHDSTDLGKRKLTNAEKFLEVMRGSKTPSVITSTELAELAGIKPKAITDVLKLDTVKLIMSGYDWTVEAGGGRGKSTVFKRS
jgi:hypothetical protein